MTTTIHHSCRDKLKDGIEVVSEPEEYHEMLPAYCPACDGHITNGEKYIEHE